MRGLIGRTIVKHRFLDPEEDQEARQILDDLFMDEEYGADAVILDDGTMLIASADEEDNRAGEMLRVASAEDGGWEGHYAGNLK